MSTAQHRGPAPSTSVSQSRPDPAASSDSFDVSATVVGIDGTTLATVTRRYEAVPTGATPASTSIVIIISGEIDVGTVPLLHTALIEALDGHQDVCCDVSGVTFFGAAGANALSAAHLHAVTAGRQFTVRGARGIVRRVLEITGLDAALPLRD